MDSFKSISSPAQGKFKDKGSKFIAYAYRISGIEDFDHLLEEIKKENPKANHVCYAYRIGLNGDSYRTNDDGEPSNSAGRPILGSIDGSGLTNIVIFVVRYFGGTKLGIPGLINAYKSASQIALHNADIIEIHKHSIYILSFNYSHLGKIMNTIKSLKLEILEKNLEYEPSIKIKLKNSVKNELIKKFKARLLNRKVDDINDEVTVPFCKIELICCE